MIILINDHKILFSNLQAVFWALEGASPLHGGKLPKMLVKEAIDLIGDNLTAAQAAIIFTLSHPAVTRVLTSPSSVDQLQESLSTQEKNDLDPDKLLYLCN